MAPISFEILPRSEWPYKYQLRGEHRHAVGPQFPDAGLSIDYVHIRFGMIYLRDRYRWDGPSGTVIDTANWMWASLVHDGLYQLMREGALPRSYRRAADVLMVELMQEAGVWWWRRAFAWVGIRTFGSRAAGG